MALLTFLLIIGSADAQTARDKAKAKQAPERDQKKKEKDDKETGWKKQAKEWERTKHKKSEAELKYEEKSTTNMKSHDEL